ncbi:hypothetical protein T10_5004 [Trichinella papuae]|uniref:Uncharacterized protein n=1 Tax=Trichinella papuae TaxID=268474 RepID=A0A0V1MK79_9BILA|nr:hypothetical protein T10_5004 [Trichinella papuae]
MNETLVCTIHTRKPDIPSEFTVRTGRGIYSRIFSFDRQLSPVSCLPERNKVGNLDHLYDLTRVKERQDVSLLFCDSIQWIVLLWLTLSPGFVELTLVKSASNKRSIAKPWITDSFTDIISIGRCRTETKILLLLIAQ